MSMCKCVAFALRVASGADVYPLTAYRCADGRMVRDFFPASLLQKVCRSDVVHCQFLSFCWHLSRSLFASLLEYSEIDAKGGFPDENSFP